jgi:phosphoribosyl 1,2-cyclic phosphodiesterase
MELTVRFWGVRGSRPTPSVANLGCGGNTPCIEVIIGNDRLIFDAGTGIVDLGDKLVRQSALSDRALHLFFTHFHWDHIQGLPFFAPLYTSQTKLLLHSANPRSSIEGALENLMNHPSFPIKWQQTSAQKTVCEMLVGQPVPVAGAMVRAFPLNHPQGAFGYRVETPHAVIVYASDLEHGNPELDRILLEYASGADLLVYDAQYTPEEYEQSRKGWGHSTWLEAVQTAQRSRVKHLALFHHDPSHDDDEMERILKRARAVFPEVELAREGHSMTWSEEGAAPRLRRAEVA